MHMNYNLPLAFGGMTRCFIFNTIFIKKEGGHIDPFSAAPTVTYHRFYNNDVQLQKYEPFLLFLRTV